MKTNLVEILGVPDNLLDTAKNFYADFVKQLESVVVHSEKQETYKFTVVPSQPYKIGEFEVRKIDLTLTITPLEQVKEIDFISMGVNSSSSKPEKKNLTRGLIRTNIEEPNMDVDIVTPKEWTIGELKEYFANARVELTASFAHEFKHLFDEKKRKWDYLKPRSRYIAARTVPNFKIKPLDKLGYIIYYTHILENLVRTTEVMSELRELGISQKGFLDFLMTNRTYNNLQQLMKFDFEKLKENISKNYLERVNEILMGFYDESELENMTDEQKVNEVLELWYVNFGNADINAFKESLTSDFLEQFLGFKGKKEKVFQQHVSDITKYQNRPSDFFRYEEKKIKRIGGEMLKKIHKLYALLPDTMTSKESDLHKKISSKK